MASPTQSMHSAMARPPRGIELEPDPPVPTQRGAPATKVVTGAVRGATGPAPRVRLGHPGDCLSADHQELVLGYLSSVAAALDLRDIRVRVLRVQQPATGELRGEIVLVPRPCGGSRWLPRQLWWDQTAGWSTVLATDEIALATDEPGGAAHCDAAVRRYLPGQLVPAPATVAHFVAALNADPATVWASSTLRAPYPVDRRWLLLQLARFAMPEPW